MKNIPTLAPHRALPALALAIGLGTPAAQAGSALFATTNIQYLHGTTYADFDPDGGFSHTDEASIITIEHFNVWKYGDNFIFVDITNPDREGDAFGNTTEADGSHYAEISPRLSSGKMFFGH
jgi:nucleoside-specific outer membrane channel protein Tsx